MIRVQGPWGWWWMCWVHAMAAWTTVGFFYLPHRAWVLGELWLIVSWYLTELPGHVVAARRQRKHLPEIVTTLSQVGQMVAQLGHDQPTWWARRLGYGSVELFLISCLEVMGVSVTWEINHALGTVVALTIPAFLWAHLWLRRIFG